jgi:hypothetical protein
MSVEGFTTESDEHIIPVVPHITFIHGICNKPAPDVLHRIWLQSLAEADGLDLVAESVTSSMVYWADVLYDQPLSEQAAQESFEETGEITRAAGAPIKWRGGLAGGERDFVDSLARKLNLDAIADDEPAPSASQIGPQIERIPLPGFLKRQIMETLLRDVHHYLFNVTYSPRPGNVFAVQDEIRRRLTAALEDGNRKKKGAHILVSHSMGTVIAYDCLKRVVDCPSVGAFMTIGSPLGLDEVQDQLRPEWTRDNEFPRQHLEGPWANVYDSFDPVAGFDPILTNDYRRGSMEVVEDINEQNYGKWRHDISKYLGGRLLRSRLESMLSGR